MLTNYITKEQSEIEAFCTSLALTLTKLPEYIQAEIKLSISNLVGQKELDYLKSKHVDVYNHQPNANYEYNSVTSLNYSCTAVRNDYYSKKNNDCTFSNRSEENDSSDVSTVIVQSNYQNGLSTLTRL